MASIKKVADMYDEGKVDLSIVPFFELTTSYSVRNSVAQTLDLTLRAFWGALHETGELSTETDVVDSLFYIVESSRRLLSREVGVELMARSMMLGEKKYSRNNHELGYGNPERPMKAFMRHAFAYLRGEIKDDEGNHHLGACQFRLMTCYAALEKMKKEMSKPIDRTCKVQ